MTRRSGALTIRGQSFLTCGIALLACGLVLGLGDLVRLGLVLLLGIAVAVLAARRSPRALEVTRLVAPAAVTAGEHATVELTVRNGGRRRTPTAFATELLPRALGDRPRFLLPSLHTAEERRLRYDITPRRRGVVELGPLRLRLRDSLGLSSREVSTGAAHQLLVHPPVEALAGRVGAPTGAGGSGDFARGIATSGSEDVSVRDYRHGDELRRIHWKATARTGELMVRQEERPTRRVAVVLLDARTHAHTGRDEDSTFEWAVVAASSVVAHLQAQGYVVTLVCDETAQGAPTGILDPAPDVLARATLGDDAGFARCLHAVEEISTTGAVVVALLGAVPDDDARLASLRHPGSLGLALVVRDGARSTDADRTVDALTRRGWRATARDPRTPVATAWAAITTQQARP